MYIYSSLSLSLSQTILFTTDEDILLNIAFNDESFLSHISDHMKEEETSEQRPSTADTIQILEVISYTCSSKFYLDMNRT